MLSQTARPHPAIGFRGEASELAVQRCRNFQAGDAGLVAGKEPVNLRVELIDFLARAHDSFDDQIELVLLVFGKRFKMPPRPRVCVRVFRAHSLP